MILYLGNKLSKHGYNPTSVETLGVRLEEFCTVKQHSHMHNPILRLLHMTYLVFRYRSADLLLIDTYSGWAFWYAVITSQLSRALKLSYVLILRGGNLPNRAKRSPFWVKIIIKHAKEVVCPSDYLAHRMRTYYDRQYQLIPNYLDIDQYSFSERNVGKTIRLLWVRAFHEIYNPKLAVDMLYNLKCKGLDVQLAMVGPDKDGSLEKVKMYADEMEVLNLIHFTGRLTKYEWLELAKNYDIFINTTNIDNTPVSVMEAMALGMIVISTNVGGIPCLYSDRSEGFMVSPNDSEAFVDIILDLQYCDNAKSISRSARNRAETWDWKIVSNKWAEVLFERVDEI